MPLYNSVYLKQLSANKSAAVRQRLFSESARSHSSFDIFLCHSYLDKDEVEGIHIELTNQGFSVYVDWIVDPHLDRKNVTKDSAELIRNRLKISKSLLFAISANADMSKWMPWELGYVDGNTQRCAIFPVSKDQFAPNTFTRTEYLLLYPYLKRAAVGGYTQETYVTESSNSYVSLDSWARRSARPSYNSKNIDFL